jgi:hypothetical protein
MDLLEADSVSRSVLALVEAGEFTGIDEAESFLARFQPSIFVGAASCSSYSAQAATLSIVSCAVRAFQGAHLSLGADAANQWRGSQLKTLQSVAMDLGADTDVRTSGAIAILIGDASLDSGSSFEHVLRVTWDGWVAQVRPNLDAGRMSEDNGVVLAALAAAGLVVNEIFDLAKGRPMACVRSVALDLWSLGTSQEAGGRPIADVPSAWWLVGLGHLGQANAWAISWLPQPRHHVAEVTLQDDETLVKANLSTSLCAGPRDLGTRKARAVSGVLESAGYRTNIVERRLDPTFHVNSNDFGVALFGVDNPATRRHCDEHGFPLVVDVGLGSGASDFGAISLHTFPGGVRSASIEAWRAKPSEEVNRRDRRLTKPGFQALLKRHDVCGVETLAGVNVAAAFVGLVAACLAVSEVIRTIQRGPVFSGIAIEIWDIDPRLEYESVARGPINSLRC